MQKEIISQKENVIVNEIDNQIIAQHNDLIKSVADMRKTSMKIFELAVGSLDSTKAEQRQVTIKKNIIFEILGQNGNSRNAHLRNALKDLQHNALFHLMPNAENGEKEILISPISKIEWNEAEDYISLYFTPEILPYITLLKKNFTQYKLEYIANMESKHSIVLYKMFSMYYNQYMYYRDHGNRRQDQIESFRNPKISVKELREQTGTTDKYVKRFGDFKYFVLDKAVNEINEKTDLTIAYEKIRSGRRISDIQFHIKKKVADASQEDVKHIKTVEQTQRERDMENAKIYADAMANEYTQMLLQRFLLNPTDMTDQVTMIGLGKKVYIKYDKVKEQLGMDALERHLDYVHDHINDWNRHTNIAKYLEKAVDDYILKNNL